MSGDETSAKYHPVKREGLGRELESLGITQNAQTCLAPGDGYIATFLQCAIYITRPRLIFTFYFAEFLLKSIYIVKTNCGVAQWSSIVHVTAEYAALVAPHRHRPSHHAEHC